MSNVFFFFKQKTAYAVRIMDWSSDVCSSDLPDRPVQQFAAAIGADIIQRLRTCRAESAFEGADEGTASRSREVSPAPFAVWPHLKHQAAASATAVQMRSTTSFTWSSR